MTIMDDKLTNIRSLLSQAKELVEDAQADAEGEMDELENEDDSENADRIEELKVLIDALEDASDSISDVIERLPS